MYKNKSNKNIQADSTQDLLRSTISVLSSHEFMVPLNGILDFSTFLQRENPSLNDDAKKELANNINKGAVKLKSIAEKFSLWNCLLQEQKSKPNELFEIQSEQILDMLIAESQIIGRSLDLTSFSADKEVYKLFGRENAFRIAIRELIQNALRFSDLTSVVTVSIKKSGKKIIISIINQSLAATTYELQRYKVFSQLHYKKTKQNGVGLGLEIARLGVSQCGGRIKIQQGKENQQIIVNVILSEASFTKTNAL